MPDAGDKGKEMKADIVIGTQLGDEAKAKITYHLLKSGRYTHCLRFGGGHNCGHTMYHNGEKFITHGIPAGVFFGVHSVIGCGCVIHPQKLLDELESLEKRGVEVHKFLKIDYNVHIIQDHHIEEDSKDTKIGTTKSGNGPAYRDKHARIGKRAEDCKELQPYWIDTYEEFHRWPNCFILGEGHQGFGLDIDWSDQYPYVTSTSCTVASAIQNGIPYNSIRKVYGAAKVYETYSGFKNFQKEDEIFNKIADVGKEIGATTGRRRKVGFLDLYKLKKAVEVNGVTDLVISKVDILREVGCWKLIDFDGQVFDCGDEDYFKQIVQSSMPVGVEVIWSERPDAI